MSTLPVRFARWVGGVALVVAAGSFVAAVNWYSTWMSFAHLDVESGRGAVSLSTVEAQATFQQWMLVALASLVVCAAVSATLRLARRGAGDQDVVREHAVEGRRLVVQSSHGGAGRRPRP